jgi:gluconolactonase
VGMRHERPPARLVAPDADPSAVSTGHVFTEGPVWLPEGSLLFSDMRAGRRLRWRPDTGTSVVCADTAKANGMTLAPDGRLLVCEHVTSSVTAMSVDGSGGDRTVLASHYRGKELNSPNDIVTHSDGSVWFTDPPAGRRNDVSGLRRPVELDFQAVFRLAPDGELSPVATGFLLVNGLAFSPDERNLYVTDTLEGVLLRFDVGTDGALSDRTVLCDELGPFDEHRGWTDGVKVDRDGNIWTTGPDGIWVLAPDGTVLGVVPVPEPAANLCWGGRRGTTLFITASTSVYALETATTGPANQRPERPRKDHRDR